MLDDAAKARAREELEAWGVSDVSDTDDDMNIDSDLRAGLALLDAEENGNKGDDDGGNGGYADNGEAGGDDEGIDGAAGDDSGSGQVVSKRQGAQTRSSSRRHG